MRFIPTKTHGILDYMVGILLIAAPGLLGFRHGGAETWVPVALGILALLISMLTDYEAGLIRIIPMPVHLGIDALSGLLLAVSPWLLGFSDLVYLPHLIIGLFEIIASLTTRKTVNKELVRRRAAAHRRPGHA